MLTKHDTEVARLIGGYPEVRADNCTWCEGPLELPSAETVVSERTLILDGVRIRPDITALDANNEPVALVEVIDTHPLRPDAMSAVLKTSIPTFLVSIQKQKPRAVYCSTFCWVHRDEERLSGLESCAGCDTLDFTNGSYRDWDGDPHYAFCLECAAGFSDAQWKSPGSLIGGDDPLPSGATIPEKFLAFNSTEFWAMVWEGRVKYPSQPYTQQRDESATAKRLDQVEQAIDAEQWERAFELLQPIGAPGWGARECPPLYAWQPENCRRVNEAWIRLREYRLSELPDSVIAIIRQRGFREDSRRKHVFESEQEELRLEVERERQQAEFDEDKAGQRAEVEAKITAMEKGLETLNDRLRTNRSTARGW